MLFWQKALGVNGLKQKLITGFWLKGLKSVNTNCVRFLLWIFHWRCFVFGICAGIGHFRVASSVRLCQDESKCETFHDFRLQVHFMQIKLIFIGMVSHRLVLKQRHSGTRKWPISWKWGTTKTDKQIWETWIAWKLFFPAIASSVCVMLERLITVQNWKSGGSY